MTGCNVSTAGCGERARTGRAKLRADLTALTTHSMPGGCDCARCCPPPLTDIEAQRALHHVTDEHAVAYARSEVAVASLYGCEDCDGWVPTFTKVA